MKKNNNRNLEKIEIHIFCKKHYLKNGIFEKKILSNTFFFKINNSIKYFS